MPPVSHDPRLRLTRRSALVAVGTLATGCTDDKGPGSRPRRKVTSGEPEPTDADLVLVADALAGQRDMLALLDSVGQRHPGLRRRLSPLVRAHGSHVGVLDRAVPSGGRTASPDRPRRSALPVPRDPTGAVAGVVAAERRLAVATKQLAFAARSGALARILGSMGASAAQHAAALEAADARRSGR